MARSAVWAVNCAPLSVLPRRSMSNRRRTLRKMQHSHGERYASDFQINMLRCIFCGYCEEACPTGAIILGNEYELSGYTRESLIYTKEMLTEKNPGRIRTRSKEGDLMAMTSTSDLIQWILGAVMILSSLGIILLPPAGACEPLVSA